MNDTVSESGLDAAQLAADEAIRHGTFSDEGEALNIAVRAAIRAYLAATKPSDGMVQVGVEAMVRAIDEELPPGVAHYQEYVVRSVLNAALASPPMPGRGEGFVLVPVRPTEAMMQAGLYQSSADSEWSDVYSMWTDMVKVAENHPESPAASRPKEDTQQ